MLELKRVRLISHQHYSDLTSETKIRHISLEFPLENEGMFQLKKKKKVGDKNSFLVFSREQTTKNGDFLRESGTSGYRSEHAKGYLCKIHNNKLSTLLA